MAANSPYTPLLGENRIRLVEILPASSPEEEIRITLVNAVIDEAPSYQALSYIWGDLEQKSTIICDGRTMSIRSNLSRLLRSLRRNKKRFSFLSRDRAHSDLFWIDAISVNQSDAKERYHQVTQMPLIYFRAAQTILVRITGRVFIHLIHDTAPRDFPERRFLSGYIKEMFLACKAYFAFF